MTTRSLFHDDPSLEIYVSSQEVLERMEDRWEESVACTPRDADRETLCVAFRKTVLAMCDETDPYAAEQLARFSFQGLRRITDDAHDWSFRGFRRAVRKRGHW